MTRTAKIIMTKSKMKPLTVLLWVLILLAVFYRNETLEWIFNRRQDNFCPCR
jgi:hypothetical protein